MSGIPADALHGCQTKLFTPGGDDVGSIYKEIYTFVIVLNDES